MNRPLPPDTDEWFESHRPTLYRTQTQRVVLDIDYDPVTEDPPFFWFWENGVELVSNRCRLVSAEPLVDGSPR